MAGFQRMQQRLAGKVERRPNLARFQNVANTVLKPGAVPAELILERLREKNLFQFLDSLVAEKVLCRLFAVAFVAVGHIGIKVNLISGLAIEEMGAVRDALEAAGLKADAAEVSMIPSTKADMDAETAPKLLRLIDMLEDCDDVQEVYHNGEISDEVAATL